MAVAAFIVSLLAAAIALVSLLLAMRADRRAIRTEKRDERRLELQTDEASARRRARPVITPKGGSGGPTAERVSHEYLVRNAGNATASELSLWIVDGKGAAVSTRAGGTVVVAPGEAVAATVEVPKPLHDEQELIVRWRDQDGEHTEPTGIRPPRHM